MKIKAWLKVKKNWIGVAAGVLVILVLFKLMSGSKATEEKAPRLTATAKVDDMVIMVTGSGEIQAKDSHKIVPKIRQNATISFLVPDGTRVRKDDLIAQLNTDNLDRAIEDLESDLKEYLNDLDSVKTDLEIQLIDNQTRQKSAEQGVQRAKLQLDEYLHGDLPLSRRNAELNLQTAQSELARKEKRYKDLQGLLKEGFVTEDEVEEARIEIETAKVSLETATIKKENLETYTIPLKKATAENELERAKTELEKTLKTNKSTLRTKELEVTEAERKVEKIKEDLQETKDDRTSYIIAAPAEGVIQYGDPTMSWRRNEIQVGATISRGQVLMTIPAITSLLADININEADIQKIRLGQKAYITVDALSGPPIEGEVIKVAEVANTGNVLGSDTKEFSVKIHLAKNKDLKPGFSCQAEIVTKTLADAVQIPVQAIFKDGDLLYVHLVGRRANERHPVTIGSTSTTLVEIQEGLTEGQRVYLSPPASENLY